MAGKEFFFPFKWNGQPVRAELDRDWTDEELAVINDPRWFSSLIHYLTLGGNQEAFAERIQEIIQFSKLKREEEDRRRRRAIEDEANRQNLSHERMVENQRRQKAARNAKWAEKLGIPDVDQATIRSFYGKTIRGVTLGHIREIGHTAGSYMLIRFDDCPSLKLMDHNQCCESRHITTDDDLRDLVGCKLLKISFRSGRGSSENSDGDPTESNETMFIEIATDKGFVTLCAHNDHNGYYTGFDFEAHFCGMTRSDGSFFDDTEDED
jgi:hypothetical protein